jgi:hypothetical protein
MRQVPEQFDGLPSIERVYEKVSQRLYETALKLEHPARYGSRGTHALGDVINNSLAI